MNFPSRNTNTKAWMYNTWHQKQTHKKLIGPNVTDRPFGGNIITFKDIIWGKMSKLLQSRARFDLLCSYRHAGAAFGEVHHSRVELVLEEVSVCHHSPSQCQTGGRHQGCSHHFGLSFRYCGGETHEVRHGGGGAGGCLWKLTYVEEQHANRDIFYLLTIGRDGQKYIKMYFDTKYKIPLK